MSALPASKAVADNLGHWYQASRDKRFTIVLCEKHPENLVFLQEIAYELMEIAPFFFEKAHLLHELRNRFVFVLPQTLVSISIQLC